MREESPVIKPVFVVRPDQSPKHMLLPQIVDALDPPARLHLRQRWYAPAPPRIRARDLRLLRQVEPCPVLVRDLAVEGRVDHVKDVPEGDRGHSGGHRGRGISVIVELEVDRPLRDGVVRDAHAREGRVRRSLLEFVCGHDCRLAVANPTEGGKGWRGDVEVKVGAWGFAVQEGVDLEVGRVGARPW